MRLWTNIQCSFFGSLQAGERYVPLLRISLLQLEMVDRVVQDGTAIQPKSNKIVDQADADTIAARRVSTAALCKCGSRYAFCILCDSRWLVVLAVATGQEGGEDHPPHAVYTHNPAEAAAL